MSPYQDHDEGWEELALKRTTIWLAPRERAALRALALRLGRTQSDLIREGVRRVLAARSASEAGRARSRARPRWEDLTDEELAVLGHLNLRRRPSEITTFMNLTLKRVQECIAEIERKQGLTDLSKGG